VDHIWIGSHLLATVTNKGDVPGQGWPECFIATVAFGSPLAEELLVFRAFRDRFLGRFVIGESFIDWYYDKGPWAAEWINHHRRARFGTRMFLVLLAVPLKIAIFGNLIVILLAFTLSLIALALARKYGLSWQASIISSFILASFILLMYSVFIDARKAMASVTQLDVYYYTSDHIGRPFNLRDDNNTLRWKEQHYPFSESINEATVGGDMIVGGGTWQITWKPNFRFPGQYEDTDMGTAANSRPLFVQNHYREYMPRFGRYNRVDPIMDVLKGNGSSALYGRHINSYFNYFLIAKQRLIILNYSYVINNPFRYYDIAGLECTYEIVFFDVPGNCPSDPEDLSIKYECVDKAPCRDCTVSEEFCFQIYEVEEVDGKAELRPAGIHYLRCYYTCDEICCSFS
jgi:hypothetical protein